MAESAQNAAAGLIDELMSDGYVEAPEGEQQQTEDQEQQEESAVEIPEFEVELPESISRLIDEPEEIEEEEPLNLDDEEEDVFEDDNTSKQLKKLQKQLAWEREQRIKASRKSWAAEAQKYFKFSNPEVIQADSRRAFLRQAKVQHDAVAKVVKPIVDQLKTQQASVKEHALAEARAEAERMWGRPPQGAGVHSSNSENTQTGQRGRLERGRSVADVIRGRVLNGEVNV